MAESHWLRATNISHSYESEHRHVEVLRDITLGVSRGEVVAITGASGSGKSTLLNLLGSLDRPTAGEVFWGETTLAGLGNREISRLRNRQLGFVFQSHHLLADFTALENVELPALIAERPAEEASERARALLTRVGLGDRLDHVPGEMSGGEQQRVAAARALVNQPSLLLADEPGGNLDRARAEELHELLLDLAREEGAAVVLVTHDLRLAARAHRHLRLVDGQLALEGGEADG